MTLANFCPSIFVGKMCVVVSRPMKIVTFLRKKTLTSKTGCCFPLERDTFRNKIMEIVEDFDEQSYNNNGKPSKSSRILRVKPNFLIFHCFFHFFIFLNFVLIFHFLIFFIFPFHFSLSVATLGPFGPLQKPRFFSLTSLI